MYYKNKMALQSIFGKIKKNSRWKLIAKDVPIVEIDNPKRFEITELDLKIFEPIKSKK